MGKPFLLSVLFHTDVGTGRPLSILSPCQVLCVWMFSMLGKCVATLSKLEMSVANTWPILEAKRMPWNTSRTGRCNILSHK